MIAEKMEDKKEGLPKGATLKLLQLGVISKRLRHLKQKFTHFKARSFNI
ncbi:hypothetical protein NEIFL0001_1746 [Neisseria flavescens SK114]|nr:hypothetical protein NEIFL0001_1746 [Neisseria flavescens SK114]